MVMKTPTWLTSTPIAHRGLHDSEAPENSLAAFEKACSRGYPIELDVHLTSDGRVVVFHDDTLERMTGDPRHLDECAYSDIKDLTLGNTGFTIPLLEDVFDLVSGQVPILVEIKSSGTVSGLESSVADMLSGYIGNYAVQSFNPITINWFKNNYPDIVRGQLSGFFEDADVSGLTAAILKRLWLNFKTDPHFVAYNHENLPNKWASKYKRKTNNPLIAWTVRSQEELSRVRHIADNFIFESFTPAHEFESVPT